MPSSLLWGSSISSGTSFFGPNGQMIGQMAGAYPVTLFSGNGLVGPWHAGTYDNLHVTVTTNASANTAFPTQQVNGSSGNLSASVPGLTTGVFTDTVGADVVAAGDRVRILITNNSFGFNFTISAVGVRFTPTDPTLTVTRCAVVGFPPLGLNTAGHFLPIFGQITASNPSSETDQSHRMYGAGTFSRLFARIGNNTRNGTTTIDLRVNGANSGVGLSIPSTTSGDFSDTSNTAAVVATDQVCYRYASAGSSGLAEPSEILIDYVTTDATLQIGGGGGLLTFSQNSTGYLHIGGTFRTTATESLVRIPWPIEEALAFGLGVGVVGNSIDGPSELRLRRNGSDTTLVATMPANTTGYFATTAGLEEALTLGDDVSLVLRGGTGSGQILATVYDLGTGLALDPTQVDVTQEFLEVLIDEDAEEEPPTVSPCDGGGTVASGTNPADGTSLEGARAIHVWMSLTVGATTYEWAKVPINAATPKEARVLSFGRLVRALTGSNQGFESAAVTVRLSDHDRLLRSLQAAAALENAIAKIYMADEATIRSGGTPWLLFAGAVREFRGEPDLTYSLVLEDRLSMAMSSAVAQERLLPAVLVDDRISDQNPLEKVHGLPVPLLYGSLSDADDAEPVGVVPCPMINAITLSGHEDLGNIYRFMVGKGATTNIQAVFRADPLSGTPPTERTAAPESEYGAQIFAPHQDGWIYDPQQFDLIDAASRFTFLYIDQAHPAAELGRSGRIPIVVNLCGYDDVGDGSGNMISGLALQFLHFLNNFGAQSALLDWLPIELLDTGISLFDTESFEAVQAISEDRITGGYVGAFMLGHSGKQITLREAISQFCRSGDFDLGVNRHGQLFLVMLDRTDDGASAPQFTDQHDVIAGSLKIDPKTDDVENRIRYVYRRNYVPQLQAPNPEIGSRGLREPFDASWLGQPEPIDDEAAQDDLGEVRESGRLELEMVRDAATADDVAAQRLALRARPRAEVSFAVTCSRGMGVELGDIVRLTHFQGIGGSGWTDRRIQVRRHETDLDRLIVQLTGRDVDDLLAS